MSITENRQRSQIKKFKTKSIAFLRIEAGHQLHAGPLVETGVAKV